MTPRIENLFDKAKILLQETLGYLVAGSLRSDVEIWLDKANTTPEPKVKYVCSVCGSDDVRKDAYAEWDVEEQEWVLSSVYDDTVCNDCEESQRLVEVKLEDDDASDDEGSTGSEPGHT